MTTTLATIELLEKAHAFPCPCLFKIGKADQASLARAVSIVREELNIDRRAAYSHGAGTWPSAANADEILPHLDNLFLR